jgi:hypothetical protein
MGSSRLPIHTGVKSGTLLNHMPRYQLEVAVLLSKDDEDLMLLVVPDDEKKPSANLPFLETSLSPAANAWPALRVSTFAAQQRLIAGLPCSRKSPSST